ncbi:MAG: heme-binding protein [Clostridia bacterium]|nr:heme-binding protein [Clostridia bacterium]
MNELEIRKIIENTISDIKKEKKSVMTLENAEALADAVLKEAKRIGVKAVVCVSDSAGNPKLVKCMDDAYIASYDVAVNKAFTVVALKMSTIALRPLAQPSASLYGIQFTNGGKIVIFGGGDPICDAEGTIIGGLGVSGGSEEQDTALSAYGKKYFEKQM